MKRLGLLIALAAIATATHAADTTKTLTLDATGLKSLDIDAGAGDLEIEGTTGSSIEVIASIHGDERHIRLSLTKHGAEAELVSEGDDSFSSFFNHARIDLKVKVPQGLNLDIEDGSGDFVMKNVKGNVELDDGAGDIEIRNLTGNLKVEDGSGDIEIADVVGDVKIEDGSGSMRVERIDGHVTIDDGAGSITVDTVKKGLTILDSGSGGLTTRNIEGGIDQRR